MKIFKDVLCRATDLLNIFINVLNVEEQEHDDGTFLMTSHPWWNERKCNKTKISACAWRLMRVPLGRNCSVIAATFSMKNTKGNPSMHQQ